jgi:hypothetical protein
MARWSVLTRRRFIVQAIFKVNHSTANKKGPKQLLRTFVFEPENDYGSL